MIWRNIFLLVRDNFLFFHTVNTEQCTVWKNEKFSLTEKKFRQLNYLVISFMKVLRKKYERAFLQFPHCALHSVEKWKNTHKKILRQINSLVISLAKKFTTKLLSRNFYWFYSFIVVRTLWFHVISMRNFLFSLLPRFKSDDEDLDFIARGKKSGRVS